MKSQFIHVEAYSDKRTKTKADASGVLAECRREESHSKHVEKEHDTEKVYGYSIPKLELIIDEAKKEKIDGKAIRKDARYLLAGIASYPIEYEDPEFNEKHYDIWLRLTLKFLKKEYGDKLKSVILHKDEAKPHVHFYCLDEKTMSCTNIHAGMKEEKESKKTSRNAKKGAYLEGMSKFQDRYYEEVSFRISMTRCNQTKCERLERKKYLEIKKAKEMAEEEIEKNRKLENENKMLKSAGGELGKRYTAKEKLYKLKENENIELKKEVKELNDEITGLKGIISQLKEEIKITWDNAVERTRLAFKREREYTREINEEYKM